MGKAKINVDTFRVIAHRGLHNKEVSENSLKAFSLAIENNIPFEFDVHLSKDEKIIVCHDAELERVTGKKGYIPELTLEQIKKEYRLKDGQEVPTFEEVLSLNPNKVPMVIELKVDRGNFTSLTNAIKPLLKRIGDKTRATIISFDPRALLKCRGLGFTRGFLLCKEYERYKIFSRYFDYVDVETTLVDDRYIKKLRKKGRPVNVWTIENEEELNRCAPYVDMMTFQFLPIEKVKKAMEG
ncbi:MAG: hypothetical protein K6B65_04085 [Bacilli bacterium]|nr:hypothetical protein [Bacilli bacterium]